MIVDSHENKYISSFNDINNTCQIKQTIQLVLNKKDLHFTRFIASGEALKGNPLKSIICLLI